MRPTVHDMNTTVVIDVSHDREFTFAPDPGRGKKGRAQERAALRPATVHHETRQQRRAAARAAAKTS